MCGLGGGGGWVGSGECLCILNGYGGREKFHPKVQDVN